MLWEFCLESAGLAISVRELLLGYGLADWQDFLWWSRRYQDFYFGSIVKDKLSTLLTASRSVP